MTLALLHASLRCRSRALLIGCVLGLSCGSTPSSPSASDATIVIGAAGLSPAEVRIKAWGRVMFTNNDTRPHAIASDPINVHTDCPPVNQLGTLNPGESRSTGTMNLARTCGFHDHLNQADARLKGRIVVD